MSSLNPAPELLTGTALAERVKAISRGAGARLAVAFWGGGAAKDLFGSADTARQARILCDVTLGGTQEKALRELGAPDNKRLRQVRALHAKLYLSDQGVVIGSANASTAALGFDGRAPRHVELGAYHPPGADMWQAARTWFDDLYRPAARVDDDALARARMSWRPPPPALDARPGSLLDAVRLHPDRYRALGFFLEKIPLTEPEARTERAASMAVARSRRERDLIAACSVHDMFTGLTEAEVRDTPPFFIEFWQTSGEGIRVFGRRVEHRDRENGTLYTSKDARAVGRQVPGGMPSLAEAARNDNATVRALLARRRSGARFLGPDALVRAMEEH
ncbi:phospholipase D family protein [Sphingomonas sp. T9W2]|uniref:phospholipase D family protein n=1 Tax=Sphingomonas sp. T9W2 TaxID=3143183 RepID=UPI0031F5CE29